MAVVGEAIAVVGPTGRAADLRGTHEAVALECHQVLTDGHRGESERRCEVVDGRAVGALEQGEDVGLG